MSPDRSLVLQEGGPLSETLGPQPEPFLTGNPNPRACPESLLLVCKRLASPPSGQRPRPGAWRVDGEAGSCTELGGGVRCGEETGPRPLPPHLFR